MDNGQLILKNDFTFQILFLIVACIFNAKIDNKNQETVFFENYHQELLQHFSLVPRVRLPGSSWISRQESWIPEVPVRI